MDEQNKTPETYPMVFNVTLSVRDLAASKQWYEQALGFQHIFSMPGPSGETVLMHLRWTKFADLLLIPDRTPVQHAPKGAGISINFSVTNGSVDELAERARQHAARIVSEPQNRPWNTRDFAVADPDGFILTFSKGPIEAGLGMDKIITRIRDQDRA